MKTFKPLTSVVLGFGVVILFIGATAAESYIRNLSQTATTVESDDYMAVDGTTKRTRKIRPWLVGNKVTSAMAALEVDTSGRVRNTKTLTGTTVFTFSEAPPDGTLVPLTLTGHTAAVLVNIPSCFSSQRQTNITSFIMSANYIAEILLIRNNGVWTIVGEPYWASQVGPSTSTDNSDWLFWSFKNSTYTETATTFAGLLNNPSYNTFGGVGYEVGHPSDTTIARVGAGQISVESVNVVTTSSTDTLTNKTIDAAGNALKLKSYIYLTHPHLADGTGATLGTTATAIGYGHGTFTHSADEAANYVEYYFQVPEDIDTSVALRGRLKILLGGADTAAHEYVLSSVSVADSAVPTSATLANPILIAITDGTGASGDVVTSAWTTLTSWAGALTAGQTWRIRLARDGDEVTTDASAVNSTELGLVIEYGITQ